ncbi:ABC transporter permease subunit [Halorubellus sp. JP-L1]|uniref:ABC transporter permease subunit n=1 Tax=Halorubellus sp. JP-L1 TaxID=2715753 RepID=UPI00140A7698|nr:ABC transporter permease subunit [Halorubellus sp. JP-L1]NHN43035.1 ABC transporter permease subunit [Halorubellus sp. JP-L1]
MTLGDVATNDLTATSRSRGLWALATVLALLFAGIAYGFSGYQLSPAETVRALFSVLGMVLAFLLPIVALVATYMAIAGERESGGVKFLLAFPNTRRDVFLGKLASRFLVVAAGLCFAFLAATTVAAAKHGVVLAGLVLGLLALSLAYAGAFVSIAISVSAAVATRSRAVTAAIGSYFLLVLLYVVPGVRITAIVRWFHTRMLGFEPNLDLYNAITFTSPYVAYRKATNLLLPPEQQASVFRRTADATGALPWYLADEVALVVLAAWIVVPLALGYQRFSRADLL